MKKYLLPTIILFIYIVPKTATSQDFKSKTDTSQIEPQKIYYAVASTGLYYAVSTYLLNNTWYKNKKIVSFHFYNDNKGYLQVDKFGHMFGSYVYSYIGYHGLLKFGATRKEALYFGSTWGFILQFPIEIMDGIHEGYGFSLGDIAANTMGSALVLGQELLFGEQIIKYKFSYWESRYSGNSNGLYGKTTMDRLLKDYNGHTYWLSMPVNKIIFKQRLSDWINVSVGYGANGMYGEFDNVSAYNGVAIPKTKRYRQYLLSLDIDWPKIKTRSKLLQIIFKGMTFIKLPFPSVEYDSKGEFKGYWIYY